MKKSEKCSRNYLDIFANTCYNEDTITKGVKQMIYGYCRCSTNETKQDIDRQERELKQAGAEIIFKEYEHGDSEYKKELEKLFEIVREGDTIITAEVSRLSRSTKQLCDIIDTVKEKHLILIILNSITINCANGDIDPMTKAFLQMAGIFSELELSMIRARVKSGIENARAKGKKIGRPTITADTIPEAIYKHYPLYKNKTINATEYANLCGIGRTSLYKYLNIIENK